MKKTKRAAACDIPQRVKATVYERDGAMCVLCGAPGNPWCHYVSRAHGGLGVEENIVTLCNPCHELYDHGDRATRGYLKGKLARYLRERYPEWREESLIYRKRG